MGPVGNTWPIELIGNTLGFTGPAGSAVAVDAKKHSNAALCSPFAVLRIIYSGWRENNLSVYA
jgi:hypothetical protein